jgi:RNA polymerase sigma factor (sigma-70 family)
MSDAYHFTEDTNAISPETTLIDDEDRTILSNLIKNLLSLECLSDRQKDYIKLYYFENYTFDKIGKKYGITREAVRQGLNKAIKMIRDVVQ